MPKPPSSFPAIVRHGFRIIDELCAEHFQQSGSRFAARKCPPVMTCMYLIAKPVAAIAEYVLVLGERRIILEAESLRHCPETRRS
jgi:hypothetical protein